MKLFQPHRLLVTAAVLGGLCLHCGCIALNIPSQRFQDAADDGGMLGSWDTNPHAPHSLHLPVEGEEIVLTGDETCWDDESCLGEHAFCEPEPEAEKLPEVPWPRFHPVPTRPVFGGGESPLAGF